MKIIEVFLVISVQVITDNVGDIASMGSDLFGSYTKTSHATSAMASISSFGNYHGLTTMSYPPLISLMGIVICLIATLFATDFLEIKVFKDIKHTLKRQLIISILLMTYGIYIVSFVGLPSIFTI